MAQLIISITEMRNHIDEYMQRIKSGEIAVIMKYGKPIAQFTPAQEVSKNERPTLSQSKQDRVLMMRFFGC